MMRSAHRRSVQGETPHIFGELFVFLLLGMFAVFSLMAVVVGAGVYRSVVQAGSPDGQAVIPLSYLANKVRALDAQGAVSVLEDETVGVVLTLTEQYEDEALVTRIFVHDGMLREQFGYADAPLDPELSEQLLQVEAFDAHMDEGGVALCVRMPDGTSDSLYLALRSGAR